MININNVIPNAPGFYYKDLIRSETASRKNIENIPNDEQWKNLEALAVNVLQPIHDVYQGIRINSGYRSPDLCLAIGSKTTSEHTRGIAADIEPINTHVPLIELLKFINLELKFRRIIYEYPPGGWIHISYKEGDNSRIIKLKDKNHNYTTVDEDYIIKLYG